jgi:hypothetical protein
MAYQIAALIAYLLDPVARVLAAIAPGVDGAAVTANEWGKGFDAWKDQSGWTVRAGLLCLEVDRA